MKKVHLTVYSLLFFCQFSFAQWISLPSNTQKDLYAIDFSDELHGVAVGDSATVLLTADGGSSWSAANTTGIKEDLRAVLMVHPDTIIVAGGTIFEGQTYQTVDGGQSWQPLIQAADLARSQSGSVSAFNDRNVFYRHADSHQWDTTSLELGSTVLMEALHFGASDTGYLTGNVSGFTTYSAFGFRTLDGGQNWAPLWIFDLPNNNAAMSFSAPHPDTAYLFTNEFVNFVPGPINQLVRLTDFYFDDADNRNSWRFTAEILQAEMPSEIISSYFTDTQIGFAGSRSGAIYHTKDGGTNWALDFQVDSSIYEMTAIDTDLVFAVGALGKILKRSPNTDTRTPPKPLPVKLYPNPAQQWLYTGNIPLNEGQLRLYSVQGQLLAAQSWKTGDAIYIGQLPAGHYLVQINSATQNYLGRFQRQ